MSFLRIISVLLPSPSVMWNLMPQLPAALEVLDVPFTLMLGASLMSPMNKYLFLQAWKVAQLSIANYMIWWKNWNHIFPACYSLYYSSDLTLLYQPSRNIHVTQDNRLYSKIIMCLVICYEKYCLLWLWSRM